MDKKRSSKQFQILSVCREDILALNTKKNEFSHLFAASITDSEMRWIANKMADVLLDNLYWDALIEAVLRLKEKRKR
jgi:hypothetical protein